MDPRDSKHTTAPPHGPAGPDMHPRRRMDARWWLLPPIVALCILGAYFLGQQMTPRTADTMEPAAPAPVMQPPPAPPKGRITVTEVPRAAPAPVNPTPTPTPPPAAAPSPTPSSPEPFHQVEPPVVLSPPSTPDQPATNPPADAEPPQKPVDTTPAEPDREPRKLNEPALEYPSSAYEAGVEGTAKVDYTVGADGKVEGVRVTSSSGDSRLDQAAADYVRRLRYRPGIRNGKPADIRVSDSVQFKLH